MDTAKVSLWRNGASGFAVKDGNGYVVATTRTKAEAVKIVKRLNSRIKPEHDPRICAQCTEDEYR